MMWRGMLSGTTPVDDTPGVSIYQENTRMRVKGELQRRWGMQNTTIAKQSGPIYGIVGAQPANGNMLTFDVYVAGGGGSATIGGFGPPPDPPVDGRKRRKPGGVVAGPLAPWTIPPTVPGGGVVNLPALAKAGTISFVASSNVCFGPGQGVIFYLYIDGVFTYQTACMVNGSDSFPVPVQTSNVEVTMALGCNGGASATTALFSGAST